LKRNIWFEKKPETVMDWLLIVFASIAFYLLLGNIGTFMEGLGKVLGLLSPFAGGIALAYILDPMARFFTKKLLKDDPKHRWLGILLAYVVALLIIALLVWMIVPQVISSIQALFTSLPGYLQGAEEMLVHLQQEYGLDVTKATAALNSYEDLIGKVYAAITGWMPQVVGYVSNFASNFVAVFTAVASSIYMLADKEHLLHQLKTLAHAFLPPDVAANVLRICQFANSNFTGFFIGKIIDSAIIGLLTFIAMTILRLDYALLISVVVGITNIIPVFGPFIGAVPGIIILLFVDPIQALIFGVLILVVQQLDGNFIGPKILGQSVGVSALWVLFAIVVGGDLLGIVGMVIGVPLFATIYGLLQELTHFMLQRRSIDGEGNPLE